MIEQVPENLPFVRFTDIDGVALDLIPVSDTTGYYTQLRIGDEEVWLTPTQTMALSRVASLTAGTIGAAALTAGIDPTNYPEEPAEPYAVVDPVTV